VFPSIPSTQYWVHPLFLFPGTQAESAPFFRFDLVGFVLEITTQMLLSTLQPIKSHYNIEKNRLSINRKRREL
jgi:hypothetical protein